jgi:hypothetical protein
LVAKLPVPAAASRKLVERLFADSDSLRRPHEHPTRTKRS